MGMGNDGIEVSNSLDTYTKVNNSGIREVNSPKSIDVMQNESAMGNITSTGGIDPLFSGATETCPNSNSATSDINNAPLLSTEEHIDNNYSKPITDELLSETSGEISEKNENHISLSQSRTSSSGNNNANEGNKTVIIVENEDTNVKPNSDINSEIAPQAELTPTPVYRNESLLRVSYLKRDWGGKRVSDIRSVSDLLETFYSLEEPIIMPLPRQREYYDQWARTPRSDVIQRLYPRAGSSVSTKCWTVFQSIQSDQSKCNSNTPLASSPQRLAPPSNGEVMCDSLDSIIQHYNQLLSAPPVEVIPNTPVRSMGQPLVTAPQVRANSGSSRSSSCGSNRGNLGANNGQKHDGGISFKGPGHKPKISPVPCGGKIKNDRNVTDSVLTSQETKSAQSYSHQAKKSPFPDYELCFSTTSDSVLSNVEMFDISTAEQVNKSTPKSHCLRNTVEVQTSLNQNKSMSAHNIQDRKDRLVPVSTEEKRDTVQKLQPNSRTYLETPSPSAGQNGNIKDGDRNINGINTSTLRLSLPYERAYTVAEVYAVPTKSQRPKSKPSSPHEDVNADNKKPAETHERFPLRSTAFISRGKRANTTLDFSYNRTRLKNLTRSIPTRSHNIPELNDSLYIQEINCDADKNNDQQKWEHPLKRRMCPNQKTQPLKHECRPAVHLPVKVHSMLDHHLRPATSTVAPEEQQTPSRRHSAVSLASVHFLDLADLKTLLKRSNTTIHHL